MAPAAVDQVWSHSDEDDETVFAEIIAELV